MLDRHLEDLRLGVLRCVMEQLFVSPEQLTELVDAVPGDVGLVLEDLEGEDDERYVERVAPGSETLVRPTRWSRRALRRLAAEHAKPRRFFTYTLVRGGEAQRLAAAAWVAVGPCHATLIEPSPTRIPRTAQEPELGLSLVADSTEEAAASARDVVRRLHVIAGLDKRIDGAMLVRAA